MSFQANIYRFRRLKEEHAAWKLLSATNSPVIIAFLLDVFSDESEIPYERAKAALDAEMVRSRESGLWETDTTPANYLTKWVNQGWLRDRRGEEIMIMKTGAADQAIRYIQDLEDRATGASASRLLIFHDAVRNTAIDLNPDSKSKVNHLKAQIERLQNEVNAIESGMVKAISEEDQLQRLEAVFDLATQLTSDFGRVQDNIKMIDQDVRSSMFDADRTRGETLTLLFEREDLLAESEAGRAFLGFYLLLRDQTRGGELRELIKEILSRPISMKLPKAKRRFLQRLVNYLAQESDRVMEFRRRTEESLKAYIMGSSQDERRAVDDLLKQLYHKGVKLKELGVSPKTDIPIGIPTGSISLCSPSCYKLEDPQNKVTFEGFTEQKPGTELSDHTVRMLDSVDVYKVARAVKKLVQDSGAMTLSQVITKLPIRYGHEELVAHIRVARAVSATMLPEKEHVEFDDRYGMRIRASIPTFFIDAANFPEDLDALTI
jgi:hypothetical protein